MTVEKDIEKYLIKRAKEIGALVRKCQWVGHNHCPDRILMLPHMTLWVEVKAPKQKPRAGQQREHERMRQHGQWVTVVASRADVDCLIAKLNDSES